jgi:hypothetical protein
MELRLIPVVAFAAASLLAVKLVTLAQLEGRPSAVAFTKNMGPNELASTDGDITGSTPEPQEKKEEKPVPGLGKNFTTTPPPDTPSIGGGKIVPGGASQAERALYEKLGERRQALDKRERDLEMRENLIKDAEARLQVRLDELKALESRVSGKNGERARLKDIVTMYEGMDPKKAAAIFDKLDLSVLIEVASIMKPAKLSAVLAAMTPESAQRLTVELAKRSEAMDQGLPSTDLKKVDVKPGS